MMMIVAVLGASTALAAPPSQADEQAVRQADQALVNALNKWDGASLSGLMAPGFTWTDAGGRTLDEQQFLQGSAQSAPAGAEIKLHDYFTVMFITGSVKTPGAHVRFVRVWVNEAGKWRILLGQQTNIEGGSKKEQTTVPAGTTCENPCKTVPYHGSPEQQQVVESWQALETAVNQRNADEWARHVGDEFVFNIKENGNPLTKADRVATIRKQSSSSRVTDIGAVVPGSMDVRVFENTAVMRDTQQPTVRARPYRAMRIWVKRDGRWQLVYSQQTTIEK
ncbi:MAG TPA: nuclear transport factor 2 family protein [Terriglobales bacterium]|nr:nuclear transport factor 2 family protein [Terriglobales bacterium]